MASRLSDDALKSSYEGGMRALPVLRNTKLPDLLVTTAVDLDELLHSETPEADIQAVDPLAMYRAIVAKGPSDCLDVLHYLSDDQVTKIFDYEAWHNDRIAPLKAINWLMLFNEVGPEDMFKRMRRLDEEFQMALLGPIIELLDEEEFEKVKDHEQDEWVALPCHTLYYHVKADDPRVQTFVQTLIGSGLGVDLQYTYSLLSHAAYVPPAEQEAQLSQFRKARLEEDGFVSYEDSLLIFSRIDVAKLRQQWCEGEGNAVEGLVATGENSDSPFIVRVFSELQGNPETAKGAVDLQISMVHTANMLCSATGTEAGEEAQLRDLMLNMQSLVSLGLETLSRGSVEAGAALFLRIHPQLLFRTGLTIVSELADKVIESMTLSGLSEDNKIEKTWKAHKRGSLIHWLETALLDFVGYPRLEFLKGLFNRFPMIASQFIDGADDNERQRQYFYPVTSVADLKKLEVQVGTFIRLLELVSAAGGKPSTTSMDQALATGIARILLQGSFTADPLSEQELKVLARLEQNELSMRFGAFAQSLFEQTLEKLTKRGWQQAVAKEIAENIVSEISDLFLDVAAAVKISEQGSSEPQGIKSFSLLNLQRTGKETKSHA